MKKMWKENRVLVVLILILVVCFIAICTVAVSYFMGTNKSVYGDRLKGKVKISGKQKNSYIDGLSKDEMIDNVDFRLSVRTIYVYITFNEKASLVEAQSKAAASLDNLSEKILKYYDINFILKQKKVETDESKGFVIMGSHNVNGNGVVWSNNTPIVEEASENEE